MRIFFAGCEKETFQDIAYKQGVRDILLSFYWDKGIGLKEEKEKGFNVFLDSGGYSARKKGVNVNVQDYGRFLEQNKDYIEMAANLDVMDINKALENQKYLEQFYPVLPVYHYSEYVEQKKDLMEEFCKKYEIVAIGGIAGMEINRKILRNFLNYCFRTAIKYKRKVHGFGITSLELLKNYPFYTVDSTAWLVGGKFGMILKWLPEFKMKTTIHYSQKEKMLQDNIPVKLIEKYQERLIHNVREMLKMEQMVTKLWRIRGVKYD